MSSAIDPGDGEGENTEVGPTTFVVHHGDDFFLIEEDDSDYLCFMNLRSTIHRILRLDCAVKLHIVGQLPGERMLVVNDDATMMSWLKENEGNKYPHLFVEVINSPLQLVVEETMVEIDASGNMGVNDGSDLDDASYHLSDDSECGLDSSDDERYEFDDVNIEELDDFDLDVYKPELNGSDNEEEIPYLDRAYKGKIYEPRADRNIYLEHGMLFPNVHIFREALKDFVIQEGFEVIRTRNERTRVTVLCAATGCQWYMHASTTPDNSTFQIKVYDSEHNCVKKSTNTEVTSTWIAKKMAPIFRADPNMSYQAIAEYLMTHYNITVKRCKIYRAKKKAEEMVEGNHGKSYSKLRKYAMLVRESNPGTVAILQVQRMDVSQNPMFKRFFLCLDALKKGFKKGCRPFIGMDGCHLKGPFGGVLLTAVSLDGNNGLFPIAFAIAEAETRDSWTWFLHLLEPCIDDLAANHKPLVLMTDRQKGLVEAIADVFPFAQHRVCCRHLYNNFRAKFPGVMLRSLFWKAAKTYAVWEFEETMEEIRKVDVTAHQWLKDREVATWARSAFDGQTKSDHITNNMSESFNNWVGELRGKPILNIIEMLVSKLMGKFHSRFAEGCKWQDPVTPFVVKKLETFRVRNKCSLVPAGCMEFQVTDDSKRFCVDLNKKMCDCNYWHQSGLPCWHALTAITFLRHDPYKYVDDQFSKANYIKCYQEVVHPIPDLSMVNIQEDEVDIVLPPPLKRLPGRPRKNRILEEGENSAAGTVNRSSTIQCRNCKQFGHNRRTCQRAPVASKKKANSRLAVARNEPTIESQASTSGAATKKRKKCTRPSTRKGKNNRSSTATAIDPIAGPSSAPAVASTLPTQLSQP